MDYTLIIVLSVLVGLLYIKWIIILLVLPFQIAYNRVPQGLYLVCLPYKCWNKLFRNGWERYMLFQVGMIPSHHLRKLIYKSLGARISPRVVFNFRTEIRGIKQLRVGTGTIIGDNALLDARRGLTIGSNVNIASDVTIHPGGHDIRDPYFHAPAKDSNPVIIGDRVYIGTRAMILKGVTIGEGAVLCAGCIVTKDVEPYAIVAGIPARIINERPRDLKYEFKGRPQRLY